MRRQGGVQPSTTTHVAGHRARKRPDTVYKPPPQQGTGPDPGPPKRTRPPTTVDRASLKHKHPGTTLDLASPKHSSGSGGRAAGAMMAPVYAVPEAHVWPPAPEVGGDAASGRPGTTYVPQPPRPPAPNRGHAAAQVDPGEAVTVLLVPCLSCDQQKPMAAWTCPHCGVVDPRVQAAPQPPTFPPPAAVPRLAGWLVTFSHSPRGDDYRLEEGCTTVGRGAQCDVRVPSDGALSGHHATILVEGDTCEVKDEGSMGGTLVNGRKVWAGKMDLPDRAELRMGGTTFLFIRAFPLERGGQGD